jgi:hypothetical protein
VNRSHNLQTFLNYFDPEDTRVREQGATLDAQLLNVVAGAVDEAALKHLRERDAATPLRAALHLDNGGVWHQVRPPSGYTIPDSGVAVLYGILNGDTVRLQRYDDTLPVPVAVELDTKEPVVPLSNPLFIDVAGTGQSQTLAGTDFPVPVPLYLWLDAPGVPSPWAELVVEGSPFPQAVWPKDRKSQSELITLSDAGLAKGHTLWSSITKVTVRGLQPGWRLRAWRFPVNLPAIPDSERPATVAGFRDAQFDRFWVIEDNLLKEKYWSSNLAGQEYLQSYALGPALQDACVEPRTWGMYAVDGSTLHYIDRREPFPSLLADTGLTTAPAYGLHLEFDECRGPLRTILLHPTPYSGSSCSQWRLSVDTPSGIRYAINPDGVLAPYDNFAGWRRGAPATVRFSLVDSGNYVFRLETMDASGVVTFDVCPWINPALQPKVSLDLSALVPAAKGVLFDALSRLWVWTGNWAIALKPRYHGYILDPEKNLVYVTEPYTSVIFS